MYGRTERELAMEQKIQIKLQDQCQVIKDFFVWIDRKAMTTKSKYVCYILQLINFCKEKMNIEEFTEENFKDITFEILNDFFAESSKKKKGDQVIDKNDESIIATKICAVSTFFKYLEMKKIIEHNICTYVERPRIQDKDSIVFLEQSEIKALFENIENGVSSCKSVISRQQKWKTRDKLLCIIPLITGIRISALHDINIEDIDFANKTLTVIEKEDKSRTFSLPDSTLAMIYQWLQERKELCRDLPCNTNALFICIYGKQCKRINVNGINNIIKKYTYNIPKKITAHKLRDTFATNLYRETGDIYLVSELLGHESPETTRKYVRASEDQKKMAVNIMSNFIS